MSVGLEIPRVAIGIPCAQKTYYVQGISWAPAGKRLAPCWINQDFTLRKRTAGPSTKLRFVENVSLSGF